MPDKRLVIATPVSGGRLSPHFGHCEEFELFQVDLETRRILSSVTIEAPPHEPGLLPGWLAERDVGRVIAGGIGGRAIGLFLKHHIDVVPGAPVAEPQQVVQAHLDGTLSAGGNLCDHGAGGHQCEH